MIQRLMMNGLVVLTTGMLAGSVPAQPIPPFVENGVVCRVDGAIRHLRRGDDVAEDYNPVKPLRGGADPFPARPRPSTQTEIELSVRDCGWLGGEELEACLPSEGTVRLLVTGATVSESGCVSRTFTGTFQRLGEDGRPAFSGGEPSCRGDFQCGHSGIEIAVDVAKQIDRGQAVVEDPGSVEAEPNNGRGESPPLTESCTLELKTSLDGGDAARRFGLVTMQLYEDPDDSETLADFFSACADPPDPDLGESAVSAPFVGVLGSSVGF